MPPRHVCAGLSVVDEDQLRRVKIELAVEPRLASLQDIGAILLGGVVDLFLLVIPCRSVSYRHRIALVALIPNRSAACRHDRPPSTAATTRSQRSRDKA